MILQDYNVTARDTYCYWVGHYFWIFTVDRAMLKKIIIHDEFKMKFSVQTQTELLLNIFFLVLYPMLIILISIVLRMIEFHIINHLLYIYSF